MKRLTIVLATVALAAGVLVALSGVASARETEPYAAEQAKLPPLPAEVKERKRWNIAVKCDTPPFGYIGARSQHAGFDVEIARWFARFAFGKSNRVTFTCVTTPAREPALTTGRNDLVIATFTYNADRDTRIDFSRGYYKGTGRLLVPNNSSIRSVADLAGKTVVDDERLRLRPLGQELLQGHEAPRDRQLHERGHCIRRTAAPTRLMWDDTAVLGIAVTDPGYKLTTDLFLSQPYGIGIRQGNTA